MPRNPLQVGNSLRCALSNCHCVRPNPERVTPIRIRRRNTASKMMTCRASAVPPLLLAQRIILTVHLLSKVEFPGASPLPIKVHAYPAEPWKHLELISLEPGFVRLRPTRPRLKVGAVQISPEYVHVIAVPSQIAFLCDRSRPVPENRLQIPG